MPETRSAKGIRGRIRELEREREVYARQLASAATDLLARHFQIRINQIDLELAELHR